MKKIVFAALIAAFACSSSFAQYTPTKEGAKFTYKETGSESSASTTYAYVDKVETADGVTTVTMIHEIPAENPLADPYRMSTINTFTADGPTKVYVMSGEGYKEFLLNIFKENGATTQQMEELNNNFRPKGDLILELDPKAEPGAKIPNSHMRIDMGMQAATMFISKGTVVGFEDVTTEAGTFPNCIKVTYEMRGNSPEGPQKFLMTEWYAQGVGEVKSIKGDKKGNAVETTELVAIENN